MKSIRSKGVLVLLATMLIVPPAFGQATKSRAKNAAANAAKVKQPVARKRRANPAYAMPEVDPSLPNVLILGDSISIGYTLPLREALKGQANVIRPATNCGPTTNGVAKLESWIGDRKWDVIHFNFGLHDLKYMGPKGQNLADPKAKDSKPQVSQADYEANLRTIATRLKKTGATVIWRQTTPVPEGARGRVVGDSAKYNSIAAKVMEAVGGVETDPMFEYATQEPIAGLQRRADVHYSAEGSKALAGEVARSISKALSARH